MYFNLPYRQIDLKLIKHRRYGQRFKDNKCYKCGQCGSLGIMQVGWDLMLLKHIAQTSLETVA